MHFLTQWVDSCETGAFVVSNDRYLDHTEYDAEWLAYHRIPYMHEPQFVAERGSLDRIAKYQSRLSAALYDPGRARTGAGTQGSTAALQIDWFPAPPQLVPVRETHDICQPPPLETHIVPQHLVGRIIGRSGANINQIRQSSGAVVDVQDSEDGVTAIVTLQGSNNARAKARAAIDILIKPRPQNNHTHTAVPPAVAQEMKDTFQIPRAVVGRIIGRGGANIKELQDDSGARVDVCDDTNDPEFSLVTLRGTAAAMALAREEINSVVEQFGGCKVPAPEVTTPPSDDDL